MFHLALPEPAEARIAFGNLPDVSQAPACLKSNPDNQRVVARRRGSQRNPTGGLPQPGNLAFDYRYPYTCGAFLTYVSAGGIATDEAPRAARWRTSIVGAKRFNDLIPGDSTKPRSLKNRSIRKGFTDFASEKMMKQDKYERRPLDGFAARGFSAAYEQDRVRAEKELAGTMAGPKDCCCGSAAVDGPADDKRRDTVR